MKETIRTQALAWQHAKASVDAAANALKATVNSMVKSDILTAEVFAEGLPGDGVSLRVRVGTKSKPGERFVAYERYFPRHGDDLEALVSEMEEYVLSELPGIWNPTGGLVRQKAIDSEVNRHERVVNIKT